MNHVSNPTQATPASKAPPAHGTIRPAVDVYETPTGYMLLADMPGVTAEQLDVQVEDGQLTLHGRPATPTDANGHREFTLAEYHRTFNLADELDADHIIARFQDGVLRLEIPKAARAQVRKIPVHVA
jgi:HSP20 family protein